MGKIRSTLDDATKQFIQAPAMFFVASAPLDANGHVNVSPKRTGLITHSRARERGVPGSDGQRSGDCRAHQRGMAAWS